METSSSRARFPKRMSIQVTQELKDQLEELARREYGGDLQGLLRETLYARLDGPGNDQAEVSEVLRALEQIRQEAAERNRQTGDQLVLLLDAAAQLRGAMIVQETDTMGVRDNVEKAINELADIKNRVGRLDQAWRDRSGGESDR